MTPTSIVVPEHINVSLLKYERLSQILPEPPFIHCCTDWSLYQETDGPNRSCNVSFSYPRNSFLADLSNHET